MRIPGDRIVKLLISLICFVSDCAWRSALRVLGRKPKATCVILYYHSVAGLQQRAFAHQMDIASRLTIPISVERVPQLLPGNRYSSITFDDGFEDTIDNAMPELLKRGIPATVFVTAAYLGRSAEWWPASLRERQQRIAPAIRWLQLSTDLISIGSHSLTHPHLSSLSETDAKYELSESRVILQKLLKREIRTFSFPYGDFNGDLVNWCREAGYHRIFTSLPGNAFRNANEFISGRVSADPTDWPLEFRFKLLNSYRWLPYAILLKRRFLSYLLIRSKENKHQVNKV